MFVIIIIIIIIIIFYREGIEYRIYSIDRERRGRWEHFFSSKIQIFQNFSQIFQKNPNFPKKSKFSKNPNFPKIQEI